ncbi:serine/threonine-protein kinase [Streptomyces hokutonensis]|uniref:serine/threonine-protein kinase n=1 Tax=Streptomyces hokutonensis TaxID=1306990 RepID=UPI0009987A69|nr:serine/threonine-protein kinase [Streptomyces hokutonensis]
MPAAVRGVDTLKGNRVPGQGWGRGMDPRVQLSVGGYIFERELGRGGQGVVWLARDRAGQQVVVKFLLPGKEYDEVALARVRREFGAASRVGELATARVLDADLSGRHPYIISEFVPGPTIHEHVKTNGPLSSGRLQSLALAVAHALAQIHRVGVVHRDIKPSNILLSPDGPRIIDFGIARDDRSHESAVTTLGSVLGSPAYMSPEQVKSLPVTAASDVFSLGGILYFAATGRHPFDGESDYEVLVAVCTRDADLTAVPEPVRSVIADCLRRDPAERPTAAQLVARFAASSAAPTEFADGSAASVVELRGQRSWRWSTELLSVGIGAVAGGLITLLGWLPTARGWWWAGTLLVLWMVLTAIGLSTLRQRRSSALSTASHRRAFLEGMLKAWSFAGLSPRRHPPAMIVPPEPPAWEESRAAVEELLVRMYSNLPMHPDGNGHVR